MTHKELLRHLKTSRLLIITLICAQVLTTTYIVNDIMQNREAQLHDTICKQELIPFEIIPDEELK